MSSTYPLSESPKKHPWYTPTIASDPDEAMRVARTIGANVLQFFCHNASRPREERAGSFRHTTNDSSFFQGEAWDHIKRVCAENGIEISSGWDEPCSDWMVDFYPVEAAS